MYELRAVMQRLVCLSCVAVLSLAHTLTLRAQSAAKNKEERQIERLEAIHDIENLMSQYYWMHASDQMKDYLVAYHTPGARVTNDLHEISMFQTGKNTSAKQGLDRDERRIEMRNSPGFLHVHLETSPVIELAADGKSARGSWISPGLEADPPGMTPGPVGQRKTVGYWGWAKFGAEFVKENGQWRIWHLHIYCGFMTPFAQSWAESDPDSEDSPTANAKTDSGGPPGVKDQSGAAGQEADETPADKSELPIIERSVYSTTTIYPDAKPLPPAPYETYVFDRNTSY